MMVGDMVHGDKAEEYDHMVEDMRVCMEHGLKCLLIFEYLVMLASLSFLLHRKLLEIEISTGKYLDLTTIIIITELREI